MNQLEILRESLGQCDEIILDALLMRNRIVEEIMAYKEANNLQILQPEQEAKLEEIFDEAGLFYNKTEQFIRSEQLYEVLYEMEV